MNSTPKRKSFYGFLNLKAGTKHAFVTGWKNLCGTAGVPAKARLLYPTQKLVASWDNAGWHKRRKAQAWIERDSNTDTIPFPRYTPGCNPQEQVWKVGRCHVTHNRHITKFKELAVEFKQYLESRTFCYELLGYWAK